MLGNRRWRHETSERIRLGRTSKGEEDWRNRKRMMILFPRGYLSQETGDKSGETVGMSVEIEGRHTSTDSVNRDNGRL